MSSQHPQKPKTFSRAPPIPAPRRPVSGAKRSYTNAQLNTNSNSQTPKGGPPPAKMHRPNPTPNSKSNVGQPPPTGVPPGHHPRQPQPQPQPQPQHQHMYQHPQQPYPGYPPPAHHQYAGYPPQQYPPGYGYPPPHAHAHGHPPPAPYPHPQYQNYPYGHHPQQMHPGAPPPAHYGYSQPNAQRPPPGAHMNKSGGARLLGGPTHHMTPGLTLTKLGGVDASGKVSSVATPKSATPKDTTPDTVTINDFNGRYPPQIAKMIQRLENDRQRPQLMYLGSCDGFLFGHHIQVESLADFGRKLLLTLSTEKDKAGLYKIKCVTDDTNHNYIGQADTKIAKVFSELMKKKTVKLSAEVINADITAQSNALKRVKPKQFLRKIEIKIECIHSVVPTLFKYAKSVKKFKWNADRDSRSTVLRYYSGEVVDFGMLKSGIEVSYSSIEELERKESDDNNIGKKIEQDFNNFFGNLMESVEELSGVDPPSNLIKTRLKQHQRVGLEWMILRENSNDSKTSGKQNMIDNHEISPPPFYVAEEDPESGDVYYVNILSGDKCEDLPNTGSGGILADDMGLGKTLQMISLICTNSGFEINPRGFGPTLIVCPLSVLGNWTDQIEEHSVQNALKIYAYHGSRRNNNIDFIQNYDIVITTYDMLYREFTNWDEDELNNEDIREEMRNEYGFGLQYVNWQRVVLDEAQKIHSRKTRVFKSCNALVAKNRWALSGTPVQNRLGDLYSLFAFLKLQPVCDSAFWFKCIEGPLKNNDARGLDRLRTIMKQMCLRRHKNSIIDGKRIIDIGEKDVQTICLKMSDAEEATYQQIRSKFRDKFQQLLDKGSDHVMRNMSNVLAMLLRLRQCCVHKDLPGDINTITETAFQPKKQKGNNAESNQSNVNQQLNALLESNEECAYCEKWPPESPLLTQCRHVFCRDCFDYCLENGTPDTIGSNHWFECPMCNEKLTQHSVIESEQSVSVSPPINNANNTSTADGEGDGEVVKTTTSRRRGKTALAVPLDEIQPSTKVERLLHDVLGFMGKKDDICGLPHKAVVFSQWTTMLDIIAKCLDRHKIPYERLDGSMSRAAREAAMASFRSNPQIVVFLMSLRAGNLGINLIAADHVYMFDPWWNPATEDQAVDRVYRLGQKRNVKVRHFLMENSVEEKILAIQERKRKIIQSALSRSNKAAQKGRKLELLNDLKDLFK